MLVVLKEKKRRKRENQDTGGENLGLQEVLRTGILTLEKTCICVYRIHLHTYASLERRWGVGEDLF